MGVGPSLRPIDETRYTSPDADWERIKRRLPLYRDVLDRYDAHVCESMADTNTGIVRQIADELKVKTRIVPEPCLAGQAGTARLVELCRVFGASRYVAGPCGPNYLDMEQFKAAGIEVVVRPTQDTRHTLEVIRG
jgi:predicted Fe-Mo cluster-binding NifX family protein